MRDAPKMLDKWRQYYEKKLDFIVFVFMGNDSYAENDTPQYVQNFLKYTRSLQHAATNVYMVYGGSSALWQYEGMFKNMYDARVAATVTALRYELTCWTGAHVWAGLQVADRVGHAAAVSYPLLARGFVLVTMIAAHTTRLSRL